MGISYCSRSSDPDSDSLRYLWLTTLNPPLSTIATGAMAVVLLPVGTHAVDLVSKAT